MCVSGICFQFHTPVTKENILSEKEFGKDHVFLIINHKFLEFLKSLSKTSKIQHIDYENISTVLCTSERGQMTKFNKIATNQNFKFEGWVVFFATLQKQVAEKANKSYHICKVIVVLHIHNKSLGIRLAGHPANKNKKCSP